MLKKLLAAVAFFTVFAMPNAHASLIVGDNVSIELVSGGNSAGIRTVMVGVGEEGNYFGNQFFNFEAGSFYIRSTGSYCGIFACSGQPVTLTLSDLNFSRSLLGVDVLSPLSGLNVSFKPNSIVFSWMEQSIYGTYINASFLFDNRAPGNQVPAPATFGLFALALLAVRRVRSRQ